MTVLWIETDSDLRQDLNIPPDKRFIAVGVPMTYEERIAESREEPEYKRMEADAREERQRLYEEAIYDR